MRVQAVVCRGSENVLSSSAGKFGGLQMVAHGRLRPCCRTDAGIVRVADEERRVP